MSLPKRGEGMEVGPGEELEEDVVVKDVDKGGHGEVLTIEVVVNGEVGVRDDKNGEQGSQKIEIILYFYFC